MEDLKCDMCNTPVPKLYGIIYNETDIYICKPCLKKINNQSLTDAKVNPPSNQ